MNARASQWPVLKPLADYVLDQEQLASYLDRIGLEAMAADVRAGKAPAADFGTLAAVQQAHLQVVPFENLAIAAGEVPLDLGLDGLFDKIVNRRRGGICYEQNLLFGAALQALGFDIQLRAGRHPKYGDDMDTSSSLSVFLGRVVGFSPMWASR